MPNVSLDVYANTAEIENGVSRNIRVQLGGVDLSEIIASIGESAVLDEIGMDACVEHFKIELVED